MFAHRVASAHWLSISRRLVMVLALALALAPGALPLAQAGQHASAALVHPQSSGADAVAAGSDGGAEHSIIFVGGRKQGHANRAINANALPRVPVSASQRTDSHSSGNDRSLNPQPIPPGHRNDRRADESGTHTPIKSRKHRPVANPHKGG